LNGRCAGNVYQWCDYFAHEVHSLDCTALGQTCRADVTQDSEDDRNGCVGGTCTGAGHCNGRLRVECYSGQAITTDCTKWSGPTGSCGVDDRGYTHCEGYPPCTPPVTISCDGSVMRRCEETGELIIDDCARSDPAGTCEPINSTTARCGGIVTGIG
jgi:hypothetical protein